MKSRHKNVREYNSKDFIIQSPVRDPDPLVTITMPSSVAGALRDWIGVHSPHERIEEVRNDVEMPGTVTPQEEQALGYGISLLYDLLLKEGF